MVYLFLFHLKKLIPHDKYLDKRLQCDLIASIDTSSGNFSDIIFKTTTKTGYNSNIVCTRLRSKSR